MYRTNSPPPPEPKPNRAWSAVKAYGSAWRAEWGVMAFAHGVVIFIALFFATLPAMHREQVAAEAAEQARQRAEEKVNSDYAADCSRFNDAPQKDIPGRCLRHFGVGK